MKYFLCKLKPPRPTFPADISERERAIMGEHFAYWSGLLGRRQAIVYGPVADPSGSWGVGIVEVEGRSDVDALTANDPVILASAGFSYETFEMPQMIRAR